MTGGLVTGGSVVVVVAVARLLAGGLVDGGWVVPVGGDVGVGRGVVGLVARVGERGVVTDGGRVVVAVELPARGTGGSRVTEPGLKSESS